MTDRCPEFDCSECGRHIVQLSGPRPALDGSDRCAACWSLPGWFHDPELARAIDPDEVRSVKIPKRRPFYGWH